MSDNQQIFRTAKELGAYIGASENAIHIMVARGRLPVHRHGRTLVFLKEEIDGYSDSPDEASAEKGHRYWEAVVAAVAQALVEFANPDEARRPVI